jgi:4-amino-4-deoxy-L-arabinose transferase-like glycosyltransferase
MEPAAGKTRRPIRPGAYVVFFLFFAAIVFLSHLPLVSLPYFWDEAGQFIPAARDILAGGHWIPQSVAPNIHPPAVMGYLAGVWRLAGYRPVSTRFAMLLLASFAVLAAFLLAIELSREARGSPAFLAACLLCASPLFFAQAVLAQLDAPAMLFTTLALLFFLQDRIRFSAAACVALVLVKETGVVVPLTFALWLAHERRWRDAAHFAVPALALAGWILALWAKTGHWAGNSDFVSYNLLYPASPIRLAVTFLRRLYYLFVADLHWVGSIAVVYAWRGSRLFQSRSWRVAWLLVAVHVAMLTLLGGAVLERYLLPVVPILYSAMAAGLSLYRPAPQMICSLALVAGLAACNFLNPPYPFPYENNLAFTDFLKLQSEAADYLAGWYPDTGVDTVWPLTAELSHPELGFVDRGRGVRTLPDLAPKTLESIDWSKVRVLVAFSQRWDPRFSLLRLAPVVRFWRRFFGYAPNATSEEARMRVPFPLVAHFERHGQWVDIFVNPALPGH